MQGAIQDGQREHCLSPARWLAGEEESLPLSGMSDEVAAVSVRDWHAAVELSGHGLHIVASTTDAKIWSVSAPRTTPRKNIRVDMRQILPFVIPARPPKSRW